MPPTLGRLNSSNGASHYLNPSNKVATVEKAKPRFVEYIPALTGALGAIGGGALGTLVAPGVGTAAGGVAGAGAGSAAGKAIENFLTGDKTTGTGLAKEAAYGAAGQLVGGVAGKVVGGVVSKVAGRQAVKAGVDAVEAKAPSFLSKMTPKANDLRGAARGITPGTKAVGQEQLGVEDANQLNDFLTGAGIKGGSARQQLADLEIKHKGWGSDIAATITKSNRPMTPSDLTNMKGRISSRIGQLVGLPKTESAAALVGADGKAIIESPGVSNHPYLTSLYDDLGNVHDLKSANAFRQQLDKDAINYGRNSNSPDPVKEQIAKAFRGGIDEYVGEAIPELKGVQSLYSKGADAQDFLKNAAKSPAGVSVPFMGRALGNMGGGAIQGGKMAVAGAAEGIDNGVTALGKKAQGSFISKMNSQLPDAGGVGGVVGQLKGHMAAAGGVPAAPDQLDATGQPVAIPGQMGADGAVSSGIDYNAEADKILSSGLDAKTQSAQLDLLAKRQAIERAAGATSTNKPLSAEANKQKANATNGLRSLMDLQGMLAKDGSLPVKDLAPGSIGKRVTGAGQYEAAKQEIIDVLARLRTGAAISATEEKRFKAQLPAVGDNAETIAYKLNLYETLFNNILSNQSAGSPDLETAGISQN